MHLSLRNCDRGSNVYLSLATSSFDTFVIGNNFLWAGNCDAPEKNHISGKTRRYKYVEVPMSLSAPIFISLLFFFCKAVLLAIEYTCLLHLIYRTFR